MLHEKPFWVDLEDVDSYFDPLINISRDIFTHLFLLRLSPDFSSTL